MENKTRVTRLFVAEKNRPRTWVSTVKIWGPRKDLNPGLGVKSNANLKTQWLTLHHPCLNCLKIKCNSFNTFTPFGKALLGRFSVCRRIDGLPVGWSRTKMSLLVLLCCFPPGQTPRFSSFTSTELILLKKKKKHNWELALRVNSTLRVASVWKAAQTDKTWVVKCCKSECSMTKCLAPTLLQCLNLSTRAHWSWNYFWNITVISQTKSTSKFW